MHPIARVLPTLCLFAACERDLVLPAPPVRGPPSIAALSPESAFGGMTVSLSGERLGEPGETVRVAFANGVEATAIQAGDGTRLDVGVPVNAATGALRVTTASGSAETAVPFTFSGSDRLAYGAVVGTLDLRLPVAKVVPLGDDGTVRVHADGAVLERGSDGFVRPASRVDLVLGDGRRVGLVHDESCGGGGLNGVEFTAAERVLACLGADVDAEDLVLDGSGRFVAAYGNDGLWIIDADATSPVARRASSEGAALVVGLGAQRFAVSSDGIVRLLDATTATYLPGSLERPLADVALAGRDGVLVTCNTDSTIEHINVSAWPATTSRVLQTLSHESVRALWLSPGRGWLLAASIPTENVVRVWNLVTMSALPSATIAVEEPGRITDGPAGSFLVAALGAYHLVSSESGTPIARVRISSDLGAMALHAAANGAGTRISVTGRTTNVLWTIDPETFMPTAMVALPEMPRALAARASSADVVVAGRRTLWRVDAEGALSELATIPGDTFDVIDRLALSKDGARIAVGLSNTRQEHSIEARVVLVEPARSEAERILFEAPLGKASVRGLRLDATRIATLAHTLGEAPSVVRVFDAAAAAEGRVARVGGDLVIDAVKGLIPVASSLFVVTTSGTKRLSLDTGAVSDAPEVPGAAWPAFPSPSGRHVYWTEASADVKALGGGWFDETGRLVARDLPFLLPPGAGTGVVYPTGDGLALLDPVEDRVLFIR